MTVKQPVGFSSFKGGDTGWGTDGYTAYSEWNTPSSMG